MSYILNAIRKSEQERQTGQPETLENRIQEQQEVVPKKNQNWIIILVIVNLFFLFYFIWSNEDKDDEKLVSGPVIAPVKQKTQIENKDRIIPSADNSRLTNEQKQPVSESLTVPIKQKNQQQNKDILIPPPAVFSRLTKEHQASIAERLKNIRAKKKNIKRFADRPVFHKPEHKPIVNTAILKQPEINTVENKDKIEQQQDKQNEPPYLSELDYDFRRKMPDIDINVFVYAKNEVDRFIMLNMKKYVTGQEIKSGMKLQEIRINSIVVEYRNKLFQLKR